MEVQLESSWKKALESEFEKKYFLDLVKFVRNEYKLHPNSVFPKGSQIFRALDECPLGNLKVVILGQDPYPTEGHANGLCFSINPDVRPFAKSLINIFKEIQEDLEKPIPSDGDLSRWAQQGVLLLNSILTVREGQPLSHQGKGWEEFTDKVIEVVNRECEHVVFFLWGSKAIEKAKDVDETKHLVLKSVHPSPLSAYRGFFGCKHFSQANTYLNLHNKKGIDW